MPISDNAGNGLSHGLDDLGTDMRGDAGDRIEPGRYILRRRRNGLVSASVT
jgi:hypothetical protein